jgi:hypothetical protein
LVITAPAITAIIRILARDANGACGGATVAAGLIVWVLTAALR